MTTDTQLALFDALHTLIAPGNRARLSPYVESAQFLVLFGERPDTAVRYEDSCRILRQNQDKVKSLVSWWSAFAQGGKRFHPDAYTLEFLEAYLAYYFTTNVCKVQLVLLELAKRRLLEGHLSVVDIGVGTATTAVATIDFLLAWLNICDLYGEVFPICSLQLTGFDVSRSALDYAKQVLETYLGAVAESYTGSAEPTSLLGVLAGARAAHWCMCDLNEALPDIGGKPVLLVAANILNELEVAGRNNLGQLITSLTEDSLALVIEPGARTATTTLNRWRSELTERRDDVHALLPCAHVTDRSPAETCKSCWNARREHLHPTLLYEAFRKQASADGACPDRRSWDEFENHLLSWSYVVLQKSPRIHEIPRSEVTTSGDVLSGTLRFIGSFEHREGAIVREDRGWLPAAEQPDASCSITRQTLKFCPAPLCQPCVSLLTFHRPPGFAVAKIPHGGLVRAAGFTLTVNAEGKVKMVSPPGASLQLLDLPPRPSRVFLVEYGPKARAAIDAIAFRLFGFSAMRPFQHDILSRVLTGRSILAIAATGGGKSECYILPAMLLPGVTVVVSPLKSLMQDQYDQRISERYGLQHLATFINGDISFREREARLKRMELGFYKLVYFTPEQLERGYVLDSLERTHNGVGVRFLALDEAHCISQWGHDFRPSYLNLWHRLKDRGIKPVRIALTATASPSVRRDLLQELQLAEDDLYVHSSNRPELNLIVNVVATSEARSDEIENLLSHILRDNRSNPQPGAAIVFMPHTGGDPNQTVQSLEKPNSGRLSTGVSWFGSYMEKRLGCKVAIYHSKMEDDDGSERIAANQDEADAEVLQGAYEQAVTAKERGDLSNRTRRGEQNAFIRDLRDIMVATKGFGMGIDKPNIRLIIHRTAPTNLEAYVQEAGRAGRDGDLANVVLFYSPDSPEDEVFSGYKKRIKADHEIQRWFLEEKYVRREDVQVMRAFLQQHRQGVTSVGTIFFTNDEASAFFERCESHPQLAGLSVPYTWPRFSPREVRGYESPEHEAILERGHQYEERTNYLRRILSAMYRIRPLPPEKSRLTFLESIHEVSPVLVKPVIKTAESILISNYYFGAVLRASNVTPSELCQLIEQSEDKGLFGLAIRLHCQLADVTQMIWDIRGAEGRMVCMRWQPDLLDFQCMCAPLRGPAAHKNTPGLWREYAGALRRARKPEAASRAARQGRGTLGLDDWFGWKQLPRPRSWEVVLGNALVNESAFVKALEAFVKEHDARERNDRTSYHLLLTDYIGVSEQGEILPRQARNCLRAVMLGYLETFEAIPGDDCRSCSRCRPRGDFETDLAWRREHMVVRLSPGISGRLRDLKALEQAIPSLEETERFWDEVKEEEEAGRSVKAYVLGWTAKLLTDTPGHQAALWLRLTGMKRGTLTFQLKEFLDHAEQLATNCGDGAAQQVLGLLKEALPATATHPRLLRTVACLEQRLGRFEQAACTWKELLNSVEAPQAAVGLPPGMYTNEAHVALAQLFVPGGPLADPEQYQLHARGAARSAPDPAKALDHYLALVSIWSADLLDEEIEWLDGMGAADLAPRLVQSWLDVDAVNRAIEVVRLISSGRRWESWEEGATVALLNSLPRHLLAAVPALQFWQVEAWLRGVAPADDAFVATAALTAIRDGWDPGPASLRRLCQIVFDELPEEEALAAFSSSGIDRLVFHDAAVGVFCPETASALLRWLRWFPLNRVTARPAQALAALQLGRDLITERRQIVDKALCNRLIDALRPLRDAAVSAGCSPEEIHRLWLAVCRQRPEESGPYLVHLAKTSAEADWADEALDMVLHHTNVNLRAVRKKMSIPTGWGSRRLHGVLKLVGLLEQLESVSDIAMSPSVEVKHLAAIRRVFCPDQDVEDADMAVELLSHLCQTLNPRWLTPVKDLLLNLVAAKRFDEVYQLSDEILAGPAKGRLDIQGESIETYLAKRCTGTSRTPPPESADYRRVITLMTRSWQIT